jgi:hypothetical protein
MRILSLSFVLVACGDSHSVTPDAPPADAALQTITVAAPKVPSGPIVAYRDGDGAWAAATADTPGNYHFAVAGDRYSVVIACPADDNVDVFDYTVADATAVLDLVDCRNDATVPLSGTLANVNAESAFIAWDEFSDVAADASGNFAFSGVPGAHDLVALRYTGTSPARVGDTMIIHRAVASSSPATFALDFAAADAITLEPQTVTVTNLGSHDDVFAVAQLLTAGGTITDVFTASLVSPGALQMLPATALQAGDTMRTFLQISNATTFTSSVQFVDAPVDLAFDATRAADLATVTRTASDTTGIELTATWKRQPQAQLYTFNVFQTNLNNWNVYVSPGYAGSADPIVVTLPDLASVPGWHTSLDLTAGTAATFVLYGETGGSLDILANYLEPEAAGITIVSSGPFGTVRP